MAPGGLLNIVCRPDEQIETLWDKIHPRKCDFVYLIIHNLT